MTLAFGSLRTNGQLSRRDRIGQQLRLLDRQGETAISFGGCIERHLGLRLRKDQVKRCIASVARKYADSRWESETIIGLSLPMSAASLTPLFDRLTERLSEIADRPLTPKELLAALPITNRERLRWTKGNRLKRSGDLKIKRGQIVTIPTYSVAAAESILADDAILDRWREIDRLVDA